MSKKDSSDNNSEWRWIESSFKNYGLKVRLKPENTRIIIDVESSINSDQHYIQQALNYLKSLIANKFPGYYNISSCELFGILATAAEIEIVPQTSDAGPLANSWLMIFMWLDYSLDSFASLLKHFKEKYPNCTEIELTTSNPQTKICINNDGNIQDFNLLEINGPIIDLSGAILEPAEEV